MSSALDLGSVFKCFVHESNTPKVKIFAVVAKNEHKCLLSFINSEIDPLHLTEPLRSYHLKLEASDCLFLDYDSYLNCARPFSRSNDSLIQILLRDADAFKGMLNSRYLNEARRLLTEAPTIERCLKREYGLIPPRKRIGSS